MKLLIDNTLSPHIASTRHESGCAAIRVRESDLRAVLDDLVFAETERSERVVVSADTDIGALLALRESAIP